MQAQTFFAIWLPKFAQHCTQLRKEACQVTVNWTKDNMLLTLGCNMVLAKAKSKWSQLAYDQKQARSQLCKHSQTSSATTQRHNLESLLGICLAASCLSKLLSMTKSQFEISSCPASCSVTIFLQLNLFINFAFDLFPSGWVLCI